MVPPRRREKLHPHKTSWDFDWRNPDMKVLRRPFTNFGGFRTQEMVITNAAESTAICRESLAHAETSPSYPSWWEDDSYQWGKKARLARKKRRKEHRAAFDAAKQGKT